MRKYKWIALQAVPPMALVLVLLQLSSPLSAQVLHTNDNWDECAFVIAPGLTQASWRQFVREAGLVTYFRPMASAKPLGRGSFEVALLQWGTRIDASDDAWNDTFSHPDSTHWLFEGDALMIPGLTLRAGITDRVDIGGYFTKAVGSNYGFFGGQVQYNVLHDVDRGLDVAGRLGFVRMYGPEDLSVSTYGADLLVSKDISRYSPYMTISSYLSRGRETTSKVDLEDESVAGLQGSVGMVARVWALRLGAEVNLAKVPGYSFKLGFAS
jgi:hypothetical protein